MGEDRWHQPLVHVPCARVHTPQDDSIIAAAGQSALAAVPGNFP